MQHLKTDKKLQVWRSHCLASIQCVMSAGKPGTARHLPSAISSVNHVDGCMYMFFRNKDREVLVLVRAEGSDTLIKIRSMRTWGLRVSQRFAFQDRAEQRRLRNCSGNALNWLI